MAEAKFVGARLEPEIMKMIEETAKEEKVDKSTALKELIQFGRQKLLEKKAIELYREGKASVGKIAKMLSISYHEAMEFLAKAGVGSEETFAEYKAGLKLLLKA